MPGDDADPDLLGGDWTEALESVGALVAVGVGAPRTGGGGVGEMETANTEAECAW